MPVGIVGAGAMGSLFAYFFQKAGLDVVLFEKDSAIVERLRNGLTFDINGDRETVSFSAGSEGSVLNNCDHIFIFVKSYSTGEALKMIKDVVSPDKTIVSLQNGLGNYEIITQYYPSDAIIYGTTTIGSARTEEGNIRFGGQGIVTIGGSDEKRTSLVKELLARCGIDAHCTDNPARALWEKVIVNAAINPIAAVLGIANGEIIENQYTLTLQEQVIQEAVTVAGFSGIDIDQRAILELTRDICRKTCVNRCSMLQDVTAGKKTEIDSITGMIIKKGRKNNFNTPVNETLYLLIKSREPRG